MRRTFKTNTLIMKSTGANAMLERSFPLIVNRDLKPRFSIDHLFKDLGFLIEMAKKIGLEINAGKLTYDKVKEVKDTSLGKEDIAAMILPLEKKGWLQDKIKKLNAAL